MVLQSGNTRRVLFLILCAIFMSNWTGGQDLPRQQVHRASFTPLSDEIFEVVRLFFDYDTSHALEVRSVEQWETEAAQYEKIVFTGSDGERVPGQLGVPLRPAGPVPAVLLIHGLGNSKERWWREDRLPLVEGLLAEGIAVYAIDLKLHGERSAKNDYQSPVYLTFGNSLHVRSRNMVIQSAIDCRRALHYLASREEIDARRLGALGYSMGGMISLYLSVLESLKVAVACAVPTTEQSMPIDPFNFAPRARNPVVLMIGRQDWLSSPEDAELLRSLLPGNNDQLLFYDSGHRLPPAFIADAVRELVEYLKE